MLSEQDGGDSGNSSDEESADNFNDFKPPCSGDSASSSQPQERKVPNLKPGKKYSLKMRVEYDKDNYVLRDPITIQTAPYNGML